MGQQQNSARPDPWGKSAPGSVKAEQEAREREVAEKRAAKRAARRARAAEVPGVLEGVIQPGAEAEHQRARQRSGLRGRPPRRALPQKTGRRAQKAF